MENILITSYNPEVNQTDSTPCIAGGTGFNICDMAKNGQRPIAFSQDIVNWSNGNMFKAGDKVSLKSVNYPYDWRCNGEFIVSDAMNIRFTKRGDIFFLDRKNNISCNANVYLTI